MLVFGHQKLPETLFSTMDFLMANTYSTHPEWLPSYRNRTISWQHLETTPGRVMFTPMSLITGCSQLTYNGSGTDPVGWKGQLAIISFMQYSLIGTSRPLLASHLACKLSESAPGDSPIWHCDTVGYLLNFITVLPASNTGIRRLGEIIFILHSGHQTIILNSL